MFGIFRIPEAEKLKPVHLNTTGFPNCCGMSVVYNFPHPEWDEDNDKYRLERSEYIKQEIKRDLEVIDAQLRKAHIIGQHNVRLICLNHIQNKLYADVLESFKWEKIMSDGYSDNHGHTLFLWCKRWYPEMKAPTNNLV